MSLLDLFKPKRRHGWLPDKPDNRDALISALKLEPLTPDSASLRHPAITVRDQDGVSACVAFAWAQALELAYAQHEVLTGDISTLAIYFWARASDGDPGSDNGTYLRSAAKVVGRFGCASETSWPFRSRNVNVSPPWQAYRDAYDRRGLRGYYRVDASNVSAIRLAIANGKPVVGGWSVDNAFLDHKGTGVVDSILGDTVGGHALCILGYQADGNFEIINSWSTGWGNKGYFYASENFIRQGSDLWVIDVTP